MCRRKGKDRIWRVGVCVREEAAVRNIYLDIRMHTSSVLAAKNEQE